jgi:hypothetical protein
MDSATSTRQSVAAPYAATRPATHNPDEPVFALTLSTTAVDRLLVRMQISSLHRSGHLLRLVAALVHFDVSFMV